MQQVYHSSTNSRNWLLARAQKHGIQLQVDEVFNVSSTNYKPCLPLSLSIVLCPFYALEVSFYAWRLKSWEKDSLGLWPPLAPTQTRANQRYAFCRFLSWSARARIKRHDWERSSLIPTVLISKEKFLVCLYDCNLWYQMSTLSLNMKDKSKSAAFFLWIVVNHRWISKSYNGLLSHFQLLLLYGKPYRDWDGSRQTNTSQ